MLSRASPLEHIKNISDLVFREQLIKNNMNLPKYECNRCSHSWIPRAEKEPKVCPKCKSPYWNKVRKYKKRITHIIENRANKYIKEKSNEGEIKYGALRALLDEI